MELSIFVIALLIFVLSDTQEIPPTDTIKERPCNLAFKCSLQDDPVWSTDGINCFVFRNACHLGNENCHRQNRYETVLEVIDKEKCQCLCKPRCPKIMKPVCGFYIKEKREFSNQCLMDYHICSSGQTFMTYNEGRCEEPLILDTE